MEEVTTSLLYAREAVEHHPRWVKFHPQTNRYGLEPYRWCRMGWERNGFRGYFHDIPNALRPFTRDGDLTLWWHLGRSRKDMLRLFDQAIEAPAGMEIPVNSDEWLNNTAGAAKLTRDQVKEIRARLEDGQLQRDVAGLFNVSPSCIGCISRRETWEHVV